MKVYIVVAGEYSDKYIVGVYLSENKAQMMCAMNNKNHWDDFRIEEYETRDEDIDGSINNIGWVFSISDIESIIKNPNDCHAKHCGYLTRESSKWVKQINHEDNDYNSNWYNPGNEIFVQELNRDRAISKAIKIYYDRLSERRYKI